MLRFFCRSYLGVFSSIHDGGDVVLGGDSTRTVRRRGIHESKSRVEDGVTTGSNGAFPGLFGGDTSGAESSTAVVLLVDTLGNSGGFLTGTSTEDNFNVGLKRNSVITLPKCWVEAIEMKISKFMIHNKCYA